MFRVQTPSMTPIAGFSLLYGFQYIRNVDAEGQPDAEFIVTESLVKYSPENKIEMKYRNGTGDRPYSVSEFPAI